jgi:ATP-dependent protease HslVU (ClpYQ) peptidase subunit
MSTVVAIVDNGKVWMGADSYATMTSGERRRIICNKMFINPPYLIGYVGSARVGQVIRPEYFKPPENVFEFPDALIKQFKKKGCLGLDSDDQTAINASNFLIATPDGKLFEILVDFQINEVKDFTGIGSGSTFALGSLYTTKNRKDPKNRILTALHIAGVYDIHTGSPYIVEEFLE